jgi:hypothetical protein
MATAKDSISTSYNLIDGKMVECPKNKGKYITSIMLHSCDYSGSTDVHLANIQYILDNFAINRYHQINYAYDGTEIYLKNTEVNAELICSLDDYSCIDDAYYYKFQSELVYEQFKNSTVDDYPVINKALLLIDSDIDWTISNKIFDCIHHFSDLWNCGETYYYSGDSYYFPLMHERYATDENIKLVYEWLMENAVYQKCEDVTKLP